MRKAPLLERLRAKKRSQSLMVGVAWYTEDTWKQMKSSAADPGVFEESFSEWEAIAKTALREIRSTGVRVVECRIIPEEFFAWCSLHNRSNDAAARAEFVAENIKAA